MLKRGDKVRLISRKEIEETHRKLNAISIAPVTPPELPIGAIGTIITDEGVDGLAKCDFGIVMFVSSRMVEQC